MRTLKIHILYKFTEGPWGGGNQFLKSLRETLQRMSVYEENPAKSDVIIVNSHHFTLNNLLWLSRLKSQFPAIAIIHRTDGLISLTRKDAGAIDENIFYFNRYFSDATIFQSQWGKRKCIEFGLKLQKNNTTILNAPDGKLFYKSHEKKRTTNKVRLIATSWSGHTTKGFEFYKYLDKHLDFNRFDMTFVGNSSYQFKNIQHIKPVSSDKLGDILREHDIFITASRNDTCSNSLIEALHCGLPAVALNDGGHPEIIKNAGMLFSAVQELIPAIEQVSANLSEYTDRINCPTMSEIGAQYYEFALKIYEDKGRVCYSYRRIAELQAKVLGYKLVSELRKLSNTLSMKFCRQGNSSINS